MEDDEEDSACMFPAAALAAAHINIDLDDFPYYYEDEGYTEQWIRSAESSLECLVRMRYVSSLGNLKFGERPIHGVLYRMRESEAVAELETLIVQYPHLCPLLRPIACLVWDFVEHQLMPEKVFHLISDLRCTVHCSELVCDDKNCVDLEHCEPVVCRHPEKCGEFRIMKILFEISKTLFDSEDRSGKRPDMLRKAWPTIPRVGRKTAFPTLCEIARVLNNTY